MTPMAKLTITEADAAILIALARFHYLTTAQLNRLLYPHLNDENRYCQRRLKRLADGGYVLRLCALPKPRYGQAPYVFTLAKRGRNYVKAEGIAVTPYFRPEEETKASNNTGFMKHTLAAIDVLISATGLERDHFAKMLRMYSERELKKNPVRVDVSPNYKTGAKGQQGRAVIPDGWFELQESHGVPIAISLELDRNTEGQRAWRQKVAALAMWAEGPYREVFQTTNLTIIVVCPDDHRRDGLADWTTRELQDRSLRSLADIFLFTSVDPAAVSPATFFYGQCWRSATSPALLSVLDKPPAESGGVHS